MEKDGSERRDPEVLSVTEKDGVLVAEVKGYDLPSAVIAELRRLAHDIERGEVILIGGIITSQVVRMDFRHKNGESFDA